MIRITIACVAISAVLSGCTDSIAGASHNELSKLDQCEAIIAHETGRSARSLQSDDVIGALVTKDLVNACKQTARPIVEHLHVRYRL